MRPSRITNFGFLFATVIGGLFLSAPAAVLAAGTGVVQSAQSDPEMLKKELERVRNEKEFEAKRVEQMSREREEFIKEIRRAENQNVKQTKEIEALKSGLSQQQESFEVRMKKFETDLQDSQDLGHRKVVQQPVAVSSDIPAFDVEKKAGEVLQKGGDTAPEDEKFKEELARAHYNMGNVYFERGEYQRAAVEYYQAVDLTPYDADGHYNLAYVSGEFVGDQETALKHYQWYLYLKPQAEDRKLVEEKIIAARLALRSHIDSKLDKPELSGHQNVAR